MLNLTINEFDIEKQNALISKALADSKPEADETRAVWVAAKGKELKAKGLTPAKIKRVIEGRTVAHGELNNLYFLSLDDEIKTRDGFFKVSEIITNKAKFNGVECVDVDDVDDPQDCNRFRAKLYFNDKDDSITLNSKASGNKLYILKGKNPTLAPETVGLIDGLNQRYAKVMRGGKCLIMEQATEIDDLTGLEKTVYVFHNPKEFMALKSHELVTVGQSLKPKFKVWFDHPKCRTYDKISFKPFYKTPPKLLSNEFNIYSGFAVEPVNHGLNYPHLRHLIKKLCNRNFEHEKWFYDWFAFCFQYPERKSEVAPVLRGDEGTGKGSIGAFWLSLLGNHGGAITQSSQVVGKFNAHQQYLKGAVLTEAFFAGDKQANGALKALISDYDLSVERKGFDVEFGKNYLNVLMTTNETWAVPAGTTSRRYAVFDLNKVTDVDCLVIKDFEQQTDSYETNYFHVGDSYMDFSKGDNGKDWISKAGLGGYVIAVGDFYTELAKEIHDKATKEQFLFDMLNRDIQGFYPNRNIPMTEALMEQRLHTLRDDTVATWLTELFMDGCEFTITRFEGSKDDTKFTEFKSIEGIPSNDLYDNYIHFCNKSKSSGFKQVGKIPFTRRLAALGSKSCWVKGERGQSFDGFFYPQLLIKLGL